MGLPLKKIFRAGMKLKDLPADWLNTVANIFNDIRGTGGILLNKPSSGLGWTMSLQLDGTTLAFNPTTKVVSVQDASISTAKLANASVTGAKLATSAADGSTLEVASSAMRIKDLGVSTAKLADASVTGAKLATSAADASTLEVASGSMRIKDLGVSTGKIAANAVTSAKTTGWSGTASLTTPATMTVTNGLITSIA